MNTRRNTRRRLGAIAAATAAVSLLVAGCSTASDDTTDTEGLPSVTLRVGHGFASTSTEQAVLLEVADAISERTEGKFQLQVFSDAQLGSTAEVLEQAASGGDVIAFVDASGASAYGVPELSILSGPFLFETTEEAVAFIDTDLFGEWMTQLETEGGLKVLAFNWFDQPRDIMGSASYASPEDMEGVLIRIPPLDAWTKTFEAVGAVPVEMATAEVYSGMEQGVVDAGESAPNAMYSFGWADVAKHLTRTGHIRPYLGYAMSSTVFDGLPEEYQAILVEEFQAGGITATATHLANTETTLATMESEGVTIHEADIAAWREITNFFYDDYPEWREGLVDLVRESVQ